MVNAAITAEIRIPIPSKDLKKKTDIKYPLNKKREGLSPPPLKKIFSNPQLSVLLYLSETLYRQPYPSSVLI